MFIHYSSLPIQSDQRPERNGEDKPDSQKLGNSHRRKSPGKEEEEEEEENKSVHLARCISCAAIGEIAATSDG